jgi:hypothetical protein
MFATCFHADFLLSLFFDPEDGDDLFLRTSVGFQRTTRRYIPEETKDAYKVESFLQLP